MAMNPWIQGQLATQLLSIPFKIGDMRRMMELTAEQRESQKGAMAGAEASSQDALGRYQDAGDTYRKSAYDSLTSGRAEANQYYQNWMDQHFEGGGDEQRARDLGDDQKTEGYATIDESALGAANQAGIDAVAGLGAVSEEFDQNREELRRSVEDFREDKSALGVTYDANMEELRVSHDIQGTQDRIFEMEEALRVKGAAHAIAGMNQNVVQNRDGQLAALDRAHASGQMDTNAYIAQRQALLNSSSNQMVSNAQAVVKEKEETWLAASTGLFTGLTNLKNGFANASANMFGSFQAGVVGMQANISTALNDIFTSHATEANYINTTIDTARAAGKDYVTAKNDILKDVTDRIWGGIQSDNDVKKEAMIKGPLIFLERELAYEQQIESQYAGFLSQGLASADMFRQLGLDYQFAYSPAMPFLGDFLDDFTNQLRGGQDASIAQGTYEANVEAMQDASAMGWANTGVNAVGAFMGGSAIGDLWKKDTTTTPPTG